MTGHNTDGGVALRANAPDPLEVGQMLVDRRSPFRQAALHEPKPAPATPGRGTG
jgi:hypothetical protein